MVQSGVASVYDRSSGKQTASGEPLQAHASTAAHGTLPNHRNGKKALVRINDKGPFVRNRIIDVTPATANTLGFSGVTDVSLTIVSAAK
jgi:rare lipoprotein A